MLRFRDRRVRIVLAVALTGIVGAAIYQVAVVYLANRQYSLAQQALERCDFNEADDRLTDYFALRPSDAAARILAAATARRRYDFAVAERHLQMARQRGANPKDVAMEVSLLRIQSGDLREGNVWVNTYKKNPNSAEAKVILEALIAGGLRVPHVPLAGWSIEEWNKRNTSKLDQARGILWTAELYALHNRQNDADALYRQAAELAPDYAPARMAFATMLVRTVPEQAAAEMDWLHRHLPENMGVRGLTARWYRALGQPEKAAQLLDEVLAAEPDYVMALLERGRVAIDLHQPEEAQRWLSHALELRPNDIEVNVAMGSCLRLANRLDEAKVYQDKARKIQEMRGKMLGDVTKVGK